MEDYSARTSAFAGSKAEESAVPSPQRGLHANWSTPLLMGLGAAGKFTEHVAARIMLRLQDQEQFCRGFRGAWRHNVSATVGCS